MAAQHRTWTREEHILAFNLYCKIPFGQIHMHNPRVIQLAQLLKRSVGAVSLKLSNFARLDPALQARGIRGMSHGARGEEEIWHEFADHPETLAFESERLLAARLGQSIEQVADVDTDDLPLTGLEREATVRVGVNQNFFRRQILSAYNFRCYVTGLTVQPLLTASHNIPWAEYEKNRLNPKNGLCLNALHDRAFDRHLMWIEDLRVAKTPKSCRYVDFSAPSAKSWSIMLDVFLAFLRSVLSGFRSHSWLVLENLALRHQLAVLRRQMRKPRLRPADRLLWVGLWRFWPSWRHALVLFQPQTVIAWHRLGFRLFWRWKSRLRLGRPSVDSELISLIERLWQANPTWGSRRIQAELAKLGLAISDSTVCKYRPNHRRAVSTQTWKTFLHNHAKELAAIDFLTVPTAMCRLLYVFLVVAHERRKVLHFNITDAPSAFWTAQQMVEAFPFTTPPRYRLRDRDAMFGADFVRRVKSLGLEQKLIARRAPWQNPVAERLIGSLRRECLDYVIVLNEKHLRGILTDYLGYYHCHRPRRSLAQGCPEPRAIELPNQGGIIELPLLGGLHHRYTRQAA